MESKIKKVEILPLVKYYMDQLGLARLFEKYVPNDGMEIPLRPDGSHTKKPTWRTIRDTLDEIHLVTIEHGGRIIHRAVKGLDRLRQQILNLSQVPITIYSRLRDRWWEFALE